MSSLKAQPNITRKQAEALEILNRVYMAKLTLHATLGLFCIGFLTFIVAIFVLPGESIAKTILGGIDALLGVRMAQIGKHLYPSRESDTTPGAQN